MFAITVAIYSYRQPIYSSEILRSDYQLITREGIDLGWAISTISLTYKPSTTTALGRFLITIRTDVEEPKENISIFSKYTRYNISFWWKSKLIARLDDAYIGSKDPTGGISNAFSLPNFNYPMNDLPNTYGMKLLEVRCSFYNVTSAEVLSEKAIKLQLFIIHPLSKLTIIGLMAALCSIAVIERSGPPAYSRSIKSIWEKSRLRILLDVLEVLTTLTFVIGGGIFGVIFVGLNVITHILNPMNEPIYGISAILVSIFYILTFFISSFLGLIILILIFKFPSVKKGIESVIKKIKIPFVTTVLKKILNLYPEPEKLHA